MLLIITPMYSQEIILTNLKAYHYNTIFKMTSEIKLQINGVVGEDGEIFGAIYFAPLMVEYAALFSKENRVEVLAAIKKYKEWRTIAINNKVEYAKDIATFPIYAVVDNNFLKKTVYNPNLTLRFGSSDSSNHFLFFVFPELDTDNMFIKMTPDTFSLDYANVVVLEKILQETNIVTKTSEGIELQKKNDALFQ